MCFSFHETFDLIISYFFNCCFSDSKVCNEVVTDIIGTKSIKKSMFMAQIHLNVSSFDRSNSHVDHCFNHYMSTVLLTVSTLLIVRTLMLTIALIIKRLQFF